VVQELTPQLAEYFGAKEGVLVASVTDGSPAQQAGIKAGDVITTANGKPVRDTASLVGVVRAQPDGQELTLGLVRDHKPQTTKIKLLGTTHARPI
jgi:S1-C subfamily serine protease